MATIALCPNCRAQLGLPTEATAAVELQCPVCERRFVRAATAVYELPTARILASPTPVMDLDWRLPESESNGVGIFQISPRGEVNRNAREHRAIDSPLPAESRSREWTPEEAPDRLSSLPGELHEASEGPAAWSLERAVEAPEVAVVAGPMEDEEQNDVGENTDDFEDVNSVHDPSGDGIDPPLPPVQRRRSQSEFVLRPSPKRRPRPSSVRTLVGTIIGGVGGIVLAAYALVWLRGPQLDLFHMGSWMPPVLLPKSMQPELASAEPPPDKPADHEVEAVESYGSGGAARIPTDESSILDMVAAPTPRETAKEAVEDRHPPKGAQEVSANKVEIDAGAEAETTVESVNEHVPSTPKDAVTVASTGVPSVAPAEPRPTADAAPPVASSKPPADESVEPPSIAAAGPPSIAAPAREPVAWPSTPIVGDLIDPTFYRLEAFTEAVGTADAAAQVLLTGNLSESTSRKQMGQAYIKLCDVAERLTMTDLAAYGPELFTQQALAKKAIQLVAERVDRRDDLAVLAARWWGYKNRKSRGAVLVGRVREIRVQGEWTECIMDIEDGEKPVQVPVLMDGVRFSTGDEACVAGLIVLDPKRQIAGYEGDAPQVLVAGYLFDPAKLADATPSGNLESKLGD